LKVHIFQKKSYKQIGKIHYFESHYEYHQELSKVARLLINLESPDILSKFLKSLKNHYILPYRVISSCIFQIILQGTKSKRSKNDAKLQNYHKILLKMLTIIEPGLYIFAIEGFTNGDRRMLRRILKAENIVYGINAKETKDDKYIIVLDPLDYIQN